MKEKTQPLILAHRSDLDGLASHAILRRYLMKKGKEPRHVLVEYSTVKPIFEDLEHEITEQTEIYVADFNINKAVFDEIIALIICLIERGCKIYWYDHHRWEGREKKLAEIVDEILVDRSKCGAKIVQEHFMKTDKISKHLATVANDYDLWKRKIPKSIKLSIFIKQLLNKRNADAQLLKLIKEFAEGKIFSKKQEKEYEKILPEYKKEIKHLLVKSEEHKLTENRLLLIVFNKGNIVSNSELGEEIKKHREEKEKPPVDILAMVNPKGEVSFRKHKGDIPVNEIAEELPGGGGGHPAAAGGFLEYTKKEKKEAEKGNYSKLEKIIEACEKVL